MAAVALFEAQAEKQVGVVTRVMTVTPQQAVKWLEGNVHNRPVRDSVVLRYAADMSAGRWRQTHQGIAFDDLDALIDGQHRLYAIIEADVPVVMQVTTGLSRDTQLVIDDHLKRTTLDVMKLADEDREGISNMHISVVGRLVRGSSPKSSKATPTRQQQQALLDLHWDVANFAIGLFPKSRVIGISRAAVIAVLARAAYTEDGDRLKRFAEILVSGLAKADEAVVITLRNWLLVHRQGGGAVEDEVYGKTARALQAFLKGEKLRTLYATRDDLFPLPAKKTRRQA